jgi:hypothetical protein
VRPIRNEDIVSRYSSLSIDDALSQMLAKELFVWKWIRWSLVMMPKWNKLAKASIVGFYLVTTKNFKKDINIYKPSNPKQLLNLIYKIW